MRYQKLKNLLDGRFKKWLSPAHRKRTRFPLASISNITQLAPIKSLKNEDFLRQKYLEEGLSLQEIAAETVSSWKTVRRHLLYMKIPLRTIDQMKLEPERFGKQRVEGELVENSYEQATIEKIKKLRAGGLSIRNIVKILNDENVPTRKVGARWHIKTVFEVSKR